jgi:hypothetical protein
LIHGLPVHPGACPVRERPRRRLVLRETAGRPARWLAMFGQRLITTDETISEDTRY